MSGYIGRVQPGINSSTIVLIGSTLYGICTTPINNTSKTVTTIDNNSGKFINNNYDKFQDGTTIHVKFVNGNAVNNITLQVGNTIATQVDGKCICDPGTIISFTYDENQHWTVNDNVNTEYVFKTTYNADTNKALTESDIDEAATRGIITDIANNNSSTDLPTTAAVVSYIQSMTGGWAGLTDIMHFRGTSSTIITDGGTQNPTVGGQTITQKIPGDIILYNHQEFVWTGSIWELMGTDTWTQLSTSSPGYVDTAPDNINYFLRGDATWALLPSASALTAGIVQLGDGANQAAIGNHSHTLTIGNKSLSVSTTEQIWNLHDILYNNTPINTNTSWNITETGIYNVQSNVAFTGLNNPGVNQNAPYSKGLLMIAQAENNGGIAQFYISQKASSSNESDLTSKNTGIRYRSGWNGNNSWENWATILDDKNFSSYIPALDGTGASGIWNISITGTASNISGGIVAIANGGTGTSSVEPHTVLIGPSTGENASAPMWRTLVATDIPDLSSIYLTSFRTYDSFTGMPTQNQTPTFGGTFTIQQILQSTTGQISGQNYTVTIPNTLATNNVAGLIKPWYYHSVAASGPETGTDGSQINVNTIYSTSGRYYAVESDINGRLFVNIPWTDNNVSQVGVNIINNNQEHPLLFKSSNDTIDTIDSVYYSKKENKIVTINPSKGSLTAPGGFVGVASSAIKDNNNNVIDLTYLASISWNSTTHSIVSKNSHNTVLNTISLSDMGLANALHFIGITTTTMSNGLTTANVTIDNEIVTPQDGDVVIDNDRLREYIWCTNKWLQLGYTSSSIYEITTSGNQWIESITQNTDGSINATIKTLNTSGEWTGHAQRANRANINTVAYALAYYADNIGTFASLSDAGTEGYILTGSGANKPPTWANILPVTHGGTGNNTFTENQVILSNNSNSTGAFTSRAYIDATENDNQLLSRTISQSNLFITERAIYAGLPFINNSHAYDLSTELFAPITTGTQYQILVSGFANNNYAPEWAEAAFLQSEVKTTTSGPKYTILKLGNNIINTWAGSSEGQIALYSAGTAAHTIDGASTNTAYTHTLPNTNGYIVHVANITESTGNNTRPVYVNTNGVITALEYIQKRLYYSTTSESFAASNHYVDDDRIAIGTTSWPQVSNQDLNGALYVYGATTINGATTIQDDLNVDGETTLNSTLEVVSNTTIGGTLSVTGNTSTEGALTVAQDTALQATLTVDGVSNLLDNVGIGMNADTSNNGYTLSVNGSAEFNGNLIPTIPTSANAVPDKTLGSSDNHWAKLYIGVDDIYGDQYTPIYWNDGVPSTVEPVQHIDFTFSTTSNNQSTQSFNFSAIGTDTEVLNIVVTNGWSYLNSPINWEISTTNSITTLTLTANTDIPSNNSITGYILISHTAICSV